VLSKLCNASNAQAPPAEAGGSKAQTVPQPELPQAWELPPKGDAP